MGKMSRSKGKRGELEWAAFLRSYGFEARRGRQHRGGPDSPDVITDCPLHFEVKRTEKLSVYPALEQAEQDAKTKEPWVPPAVAHRRNGKDWVVILSAHDFLEMVRELSSE
ncbi:MAG TPA: hypothetical protein VM537_35780 [Anaerolineae bacterium]|nr:hypothetical protein [Anaerolineae bacterium]